MRFDLKVAIVGLVAAVIVGIGAFGFGNTNTQAEILDECSTGSALPCVYTTTEHGIDPAATTTGVPRKSCPQAAGAKHIDVSNYPPVSGFVPLIVLGPSGTVLICVNAQNDRGQLSVDSNDAGFLDRFACGDDGDNADADERVAEWPDDRCLDPVGSGTDQVFIPHETTDTTNDNHFDDPCGGFCVNDLETVIFRFNCGTTASGGAFTGTTRVIIQQGTEGSYVHGSDPTNNPADVDGEDVVASYEFDISCRAEVTAITITATPNTVEIIAARGNVSHSLIDVDTGTVVTTVNRNVDFRTDRCAIETDNVDTTEQYRRAKLAANVLSPSLPATDVAFDIIANTYGEDDQNFDEGDVLVIDSLSNSSSGNPQVDSTFGFDVPGVSGIAPTGTRTHAAAFLHCDPHGGVVNATPGVATISVCWEVPSALDICASTTVTVIGPPASITVAASPTSLRCGEKATITATVKDAIGQNVSDHTRVELVTNLGGVLGGQGAVASFAGPVVPISSSVGDTFGGVATAFLITSEVTSGPYEVVATSGGTTAGDFWDLNLSQHDLNVLGTLGSATILGGIFSTPPVSAQVTVTCTIPAAVVAAPTAAPTITAPRTGTGITPPNTGDAGLADSSSTSWTLFALGGILALSLAGFATVKAARR